MQQNNFYHEYDLVGSRQHPSQKGAAAHQTEALSKMRDWAQRYSNQDAGGIVVLPTGGGKTFTAMRFLCAQMLSQGYKVVWLAHTHHLLEQARDAFKDSLHTIAEPKSNLNVRVVSGTLAHNDVAHIKSTDDVLIITLQTMSNAFERKHQALETFLNAAGDKLCVVFDEAHHSPAPSYRKLLESLRARHPQLKLLGLTATPTYTNVKKRGWLKKIFPQEIIYSVSPQKLMADRILAKPIFESIPTSFTPDFDEREFQKWVNTYADLPENIIEELAGSSERNALVANTYMEGKEKFGKTIIFAERWYQCEMLRELLTKRGVRADVVYSHVSTNASNVEDRNRRDRDANDRVLQAFKSDELDVLLNVRMLTEGTDVPNVNSVFITRQTTSRILLTQMVGRALRGPKFGGTETAHIVTFTDSWKQPINWAEYDQLEDGDLEESSQLGKRPPLHLVSIDLVRQLSQNLDKGLNVAPREFIMLMPAGWYKVEFQTLVQGSEDVEMVRQLVLVFDDELDAYRRFFDSLKAEDLSEFAGENVYRHDVRTRLQVWQDTFFSTIESVDEETRVKNLFHLARHMAQNDMEVPDFFMFEERGSHDLDSIANDLLTRRVDRKAEQQILQSEYSKRDRFWNTIFPNFYLFKSQYDAQVNRILALEDSSETTFDATTLIKTPELLEDFEPSDDLKVQVKNRDNNTCLCCEATRRLEVDHIISHYHGGTNRLDNLQTLCYKCNRDKSFNELNFRFHKHPGLVAPPATFPRFDLPKPAKAKEIELWQQAVYRHINFFYKAAAVENVIISAKGTNFYEWQIHLFEGNNPVWLKPHLPAFVERVRAVREDAGLRALEGIRVLSPGQPEATHFVSHDLDLESKNPLHWLPNGTSCQFEYDGKVHQGTIIRGEFVVPRYGRFASFSGASEAVTGSNRNGWKDWEVKLPDSQEWILAADWRKSVKPE